MAINAPIRNHRDLYGGNLRLEAPLGSLDFTSISAVRGYRVRYLEDTDATPLTQVHFGSREWQDAQSQEFRLASPYQAFRWTAGASIYHERIAADSRTIYDEDGICTGLARSPTPTDCDSLLRALPAAGLAATFAPFVRAQAGPAIVVQQLHCCELRVSDLARSVAFYQDLFGAAVLS